MSELPSTTIYETSRQKTLQRLGVGALSLGILMGTSACDTKETRAVPVAQETISPSVEQAVQAMENLEVNDLLSLTLGGAQPGETLHLGNGHKVPTLHYTIDRKLQEDYAHLLHDGSTDVPSDMLHYISQAHEATDPLKQRLEDHNIREVYWGRTGHIITIDMNGKPVNPPANDAFIEYEKMPGQKQDPSEQQLHYTLPLEYSDGTVTIDIDWAIEHPYTIAGDGAPILKTQGMKNSFLRQDIGTVTATIEQGEIVDIQTREQ